MIVQAMPYPASGGGGVDGSAAMLFADDGATFPMYGVATWPSGFYNSSTGTTWLAREAFCGTLRFTRVSSHNHTTDTWDDSNVVFVGLVDDDHGAPAIFRDGDGYIHAFGGAHNSALQHSVTRAADENGWWNAKTAIGTVYSYPHPVFDGTLYLFLRKTITANSIYSGVLLKSTAITSGAITFAAEVTLVNWSTDTRFYLGNTHDDGTYIHLIATRANGTDTQRQDIYHFRYKKSDGSVSNADGSHSVASGSLPINLADSNSYYRIVDQSTPGHFTNIPTFCADTAGNLHLVYMDGASATGTSWDLKHMICSSGSWGAASTVVSLTNYSRFNLQSLGPVVSGGVELLYSDNDGTYTRGGVAMKRLVYSGSWGSPLTLVTAANGKALDEPTRVLNGHTNLRHYFSEIDQVSTNSSAGGLGIYAFGAGGLPPRTIPANPDGFTWLQVDFTDKADGTTSVDSEGIFYKTITAIGSAHVSSGKAVFNNATNDYFFTDDDPIWSLLNYDWAIDILGVTFNENAREQMLLSHHSAADLGWFCDIDGAGHLRFIGAQGSTNHTVQVSFTPTVGTRYDLAIARIGSNIYFYNGVNQIGAAQAFAFTIRDSGQPLLIGALSGTTSFKLNGSIEKLRLRVQSGDYGGATRTVPSW